MRRIGRQVNGHRPRADRSRRLAADRATPGIAGVVFADVFSIARWAFQELCYAADCLAEQGLVAAFAEPLLVYVGSIAYEESYR